MVKKLPANSGDTDSIPGSGRSLGEENGNPFQYSCLGNPTDRGAWRATGHGVEKHWTGPSDFTFTFTFKVLKFLRKKVKSEIVSYSVVSDSATPWTVAYQAPLSVGFSRQ